MLPPGRLRGACPSLPLLLLSLGLLVGVRVTVPGPWVGRRTEQPARVRLCVCLAGGKRCLRRIMGAACLRSGGGWCPASGAPGRSWLPLALPCRSLSTGRLTDLLLKAAFGTQAPDSGSTDSLHEKPMEIGACRCWGAGAVGPGGRGGAWAAAGRPSAPPPSHSALSWRGREPAAGRPSRGHQQPCPRGVHRGLSPQRGHATPRSQDQDVLR